MTWIDIADTTIKIGLGAAISGIVAFVMSRGSQKHDFRKERWRRLQDGLEFVSDNFENIHSVFLLRCSRSAPDIVYPKEMEHLKPNRESYESLLARSGEAFLKLHQLEGRLLLLGLKDAADALRTYRVRATDIEDVSIHHEGAAAKLNPIANDLCSMKDQFYLVLSKSYTLPE